MLSSDDPVRVFQQFATLDLLSGGRAEIMAGRGSFIESFPLFGYDLATTTSSSPRSSSSCLQLREAEHVSWPGAPSRRRSTAPASTRARSRIRSRCGSRSAAIPQSAARAGALGLPMALAIIGGMPERFAPFAEIHRRAALEPDHPAPALSINSHGFIADTSQEAADIALARRSRR